MRQAGSQRQKEALVVNPAAAPGYAVPANLATAPHAAQHLALHPRRSPAAPGTSAWFPEKDLQQNE